MTTNMITAARLLGHKSINGKYQTTMQLDKFPVLGHQMVRHLCPRSMGHELTEADPLDRFLHHGFGQLGFGSVLGTQVLSERHGCVR